MDVQEHIKNAINKVERINADRTLEYKKKLKEQIRVNLLEKKESIQNNQGLIQRYYSAKPQPLTYMQEAMLQAVQ